MIRSHQDAQNAGELSRSLATLNENPWPLQVWLIILKIWELQGTLEQRRDAEPTGSPIAQPRGVVDAEHKDSEKQTSRRKEV